MSINITGEITRIFFAGDDDFVIAQLTSGPDKHTIKGSIPNVTRGSTVHVSGKKETHPKYGEQINVTAYAQSVPKDAIGMARFFERIEGIGEVKAGIIADHAISLGDDPPENEIAACPGVDPDLARDAARMWHQNRAQSEQLIALQGLGLTPLQADRAFMRWAGEASTRVEANPYILCELARVGFKTADEIARTHFGVKKDDTRRLKEGVIYVLKETSKTSGHVGLPRKHLLTEAARILGVHEGKVKPPLAWLIDDDKIVSSHDLLFTKELNDSELSIARRTVAISNDHFYRSKLDANEVDGLTDEQSSAVHTAIEEGGFLVLTGGPGTGKTHTTTAIIRAWKKRHTAVEKRCSKCEGYECLTCHGRGYYASGEGRPAYLAAPTGRAAKRMEEVSGYAAQTIHRLLKCTPKENGFSWGRDLREINGLVIIDEASMLDTPMASILLERIADESTVIFIGDPDQLPSIGPGYLLHDLIRSNACESVELTEVHRQSEGSGIIDFAYKVQKADAPDLSQKHDFKTMRIGGAQDVDGCIKSIVERLNEDDFRLPDGSEFDPENDVQILSPMKKRGRDATSESINDLIQGMRYDPKSDLNIEVGSVRYFTGDRVMQAKNDYDKGVFNGDMGRILWLDSTKTGGDFAAGIEFDDREVRYTRSDLAMNINRAYCVTIHKSQGSEYPVVVLVITGGHHFMLERTLLYTGITRAAKMAILVYDNKGLKRAIKNNPSINRYRALNKRIQEEMI